MTSKKSGIIITDPGSYRPMSNLNIISKVLERLYLAGLVPHVASWYCPLQSAYRILYVDLSTDTTDHSILLSRLESAFGSTSPALSWIRSYLTERTSFVKVANESSPITFSNTSIPMCHKDPFSSHHWSLFFLHYLAR